MSKVTVQNGKLKQAIMISAILHVALFGALVLSSFNKHIYTGDGGRSGCFIDTVMLNDPEALVADYNYQQPQPMSTNHVKETADSQKKIATRVKETADSQKKIATRVKETADSQKKIATRVKETADSQKKIATRVKETENEKTINKLLGSLSENKNILKITGEKKSDKSSLTENGQTENNIILSTDISNYAKQIKSAIEGRFYDASSYTGKTCTLRIKLAPDGTLLDIKFEGGDPALCNAALAAARQAKIPKPPSQAVYEIFKSAPLYFKP